MKNPEMVSFINKVQFSCHQNVVSIANTFLARVANRKYSFKGQGEFLANIESPSELTFYRILLQTCNKHLRHYYLSIKHHFNVLLGSVSL